MSSGIKSAEPEIRQVAHQVRGLLDGGVVPESIGIVARELRGFSSALRRHLDRLAIPFSGVGATVPGGDVWRRASLLAAILRAGPEMPAELWLEAAAGGSATEPLLALRTLGVSRLDEVAGLAAVAGGVPLPLPVIDEDGEPHPARVLAPQHVEGLRLRALALARLLESWPSRAVARTHRRRTADLVAELGWDAGDGALRAMLREVELLQSELPAELWLAAADGGPATEPLLALRTLGVSWLDEVGGLAAGAGGGPLPRHLQTQLAGRKGHSQRCTSNR